MPRTRLLPLLGGALLAVAVGVVYPGPGPLGAQSAPQSLRDDGTQANILADRIQQIGGTSNLLIAVGNVEITRGSTRLLADRVELDRDTGEAVAQGKVVFYDGQDRLVGERVDYNLKTGTGVVYNGSAFAAPYYSLSGERMERVGDGVYNIRQGVFTTCEGDDPDWSFRVGSATADLNDIVYGRDASFWVGKVPLIPWVPFFAAALRRERQSGFLFPTVGVSSQKGVFAKVPYYWAIDDSQDMTVTLDTFAKRGVGAELEYRYVLSEGHAGAASAFFVREAFHKDDDRGTGTLRHAWQVTDRMSVKVDANVTSDDRVLRDYADRLNDRSKQRAESNVFVSQRWDSWNLVGNVLWYQDLTTTRPVELQRAPDIRLQGIRQPIPGQRAVLYEVDSSFTNFVRDVGADGVRLDLHPRLFVPIPVAGLFTVTPFLGGRATYYDRRVVGERVTRAGSIRVEETVRDDRVRRQAEGGLAVEARAARVYALDGAGGLAALQHVIEPRATWTEIRGEEQKAVPNYDPAVDRIGKVSEVTYSITNRLNGKTVAGPGQEPARLEMLRLLVAQTYNLLPAADEPFKDLRADLLARPNETFHFRGDAAWNLYGRGLQTANAEVGAAFRDLSLGVGSRFTEQQQGFHFVSGRVAAKITRNLAAHASSEWDVIAGAPVEQRFGVDVQFQCWAILLEYIDRSKNEDEMRFSVNLLGLGQVGTRTGTGVR